MHPTEQCNSWFERCQFSLEAYRTGAGLTFADKRAICDPRDLWKIALIQNTLQPCQDLLYSSLTYSLETARHYLGEEKLWLQDEFYYLGIRLGRSPTSHEKEQDFEKQRTHVRFRLFYALKWSEDMQVREHLDAQESGTTRAFFTRAGEISFRDYVGLFFWNNKGQARPQAEQGLRLGLRLKVA